MFMSVPIIQTTPFAPTATSSALRLPNATRSSDPGQQG
jgi:hypothetical protein